MTARGSDGRRGAALAGKVALITGAARDMGRAHALRLAHEGADLVLLDLCAPLATSPYAMAVDADLDETRRLAEQEGARAIARRADVRVQEQLDAAVAAALERFGRLDIVVPNAGVLSFGRSWELSEEAWTTMLDVVLSGVWRTAKATIPALIAGGRGGSIVIIGSAVGTRPGAQVAHYAAAKAGLVAFMRALALEVGEHAIRVNVVAPASVHTQMSASDATLRLRRPDLEHPTVADVAEQMRAENALPVRWAEPEDVADAVAWLASDQARMVTGAVLPVDAGWTIK